MPDDTQLSYLPSLRHKTRTNIHSSLENAICEVRVDLAVPIPVLQTASDDCTTSCCALHDVHRLIRAVVCPGGGVHGTGLISYDGYLAAPRINGAVHHPAEFAGHQAGAVDDDGGGSRCVVRRRFGDVVDDAPLDYYIIFETLT